MRTSRLVQMLLLVAVAALIGLSAGCGGDDDGDKKAGGATGQNGATADASGTKCEKVDKPPPKRVRRQSAPDFQLARDKTYVATVETSCGDFTIKLDPKQAPKTGGSFVSLARKKFYDGLTFHRIVFGYVIQGGDPTGIGTGGPGYKVRERMPDDLVYSERVVAMAKTGQEPPGTSGSQFFVVTAADADLPPDYALVGEVQKGFDVVRRIGLVPVGPNDQPLLPVVIERIRISEK